MKKIGLRSLAAIMAAIMLVTIISGCNRGRNQESSVELPDFMYVPEFISLPEGITDIQNLAYHDGILYFSSWADYDESVNIQMNKLYSMKIDGTDLKELENYTVDVPEGANGHLQISSLRVDGEGNLWVYEQGNFYGFDLPEGFEMPDYSDPILELDGDDLDDPEDEIATPDGPVAQPLPAPTPRGRDDMWNYYVDLGSIMTIRRLDSTGREVSSVDISALAGTQEWFWVSTFNVDSNGNVYVAANDAIHVLDSNSRILFRLDVNGWIDQLLRLADGEIAFFGYMENGGRVLRTIDFTSRGWGDDISIPYNVYNIMPGGGDYEFIFNDSMGLLAIDDESGESVRLLNWIDSDITNDGLGNITFLPDGRVLCTIEKWNNRTYQRSFELIILTRVPYAEFPERIPLTMATFWLDWNVRNAIVQFNRTSDTYRIFVRDYAEFATEDDWMAGLTRLTTEIISGRIPDILDVSRLPFKQYVARGLLVDLYDLIDADPDLNRNDLLESAFRAVEIDGGLYQVFPRFSITTVIGNPAVLGPGMGWNMDEFMQVMRDNPQADMPMGMGGTRASFLSQAMMFSMDEYVDWATGVCYFDRGDFAQLLEFAMTFPEEFDWDREYGEMGMDWNEPIVTGRQIMMMTGIYDFRSLQMNTMIFGGDIVFKGFPTESRNGNAIQIDGALAITSSSAHMEGAWEFLRIMLSEEWQYENIQWGMPTNRAVFDEMVEEAMKPRTYIDEHGNEIEISGGMSWNGYYMEERPMTREEADQLLALIDSVSSVVIQNDALMTIINEGAEDFFNGRNSAQDAARIIQSRATIYIAEQS